MKIIDVTFSVFVLLAGGALVGDGFGEHPWTGAVVGLIIGIIWFGSAIRDKRKRAATLRSLMEQICSKAEWARVELNDPASPEARAILLELEKLLEELGGMAWRDETAKRLSSQMPVLSSQINNTVYLRGSVLEVHTVSFRFLKEGFEQLERKRVRGITAIFIAGLALDNLRAPFRKEDD